VDPAEYESALGKFSLSANLLWKAERWIVALRPQQVTLGALVLLPRRPIPDFDQVTPTEASTLFEVVAKCQGLLRHTFDADKFNLIAAMMKDNFVHFHLIPRYATPQQFGGSTWTDSDWPTLITFRKDAQAEEARASVLESLRSNLDLSEPQGG
jgi:diadenosine tetraphosphate (Ap4A) HIT family hydrolase